MRSLSSTVSEMPSSWLPSRSVVSKTSTSAGSVSAGSALSDMFDPVLVSVDLTADGAEVRLLHGAPDGPGFADDAVIDLANGHDLGGRAGEERLLAGVEVAAQDVADRHVVAQVAGDRDHRVARDALEGAGADGRRDDRALLDDEEVLAGALADEA